MPNHRPLSKPTKGAISLIVFLALMAAMLLGLLSGLSDRANASTHHRITAARTGDPLADTKPCVANREANSLNQQERRGELERRWEVTGKGVPYEVVGFGRVVAYRWCGHGPLGDPAFIGVKYDRHADGSQWSVAVIWWKGD